MSEQPEALRLARKLEACPTINYRAHAAELRRLQAECEALRAQCGGKNCMGWRAPGVREWVTRERLAEVEAECDALRTELATLRAQNYETQSLLAEAEAAMTKEAK